MTTKNPMFKFIVIGDTSVGKSTLLTNYSTNQFQDNSKPTLGVQFVRKKVTVEGKEVELQLWDTAGQEQFRSMIRSFYRGAAAVFLVYSVDNKQSFVRIRDWLKELQDHAHEDIVKVLVGNKCDLQRYVERSEGESLMDEQKLSIFFETSARTGENVERAFTETVKQVLLRMMMNDSYRASIKQSKQTPSSSSQSSRAQTERSAKEDEQQQVVNQTVRLEPPRQQNTKKSKGCC